MSENLIGGIAAESLRQFIERVERLTEEIKALNADKADVFKQAKSQGFDVKAMKALISERAKSPDELSELCDLLDLYRAAVGETLPSSRAHVREVA